MDDSGIISPILRSAFADALALRDTLKSARDAGSITTRGIEVALSGLGQIIHIIKTGGDGLTGTIEPRWNRPLPEFMRWPNKSMPCPKCDQIKPGKVSYFPQSTNSPERMQHSCVCGYSLFTKPTDQSSDEFKRDLQFEAVTV